MFDMKKGRIDNKEDDTMSAVARDYVYEVKVDKKKDRKEKTISAALLAMCKEAAKKYPQK